MAERKPTPGPWHARQDRHSGEWRVVCWDETEVPDKDAPWIVCDVAGFCADGNEESNAHLIAAAPDMLEALERIASLSPGGPHVSANDGMGAALASLDRARDIARAAIAKADREGEA